MKTGKELADMQLIRELTGEKAVNLIINNQPCPGAWVDCLVAKSQGWRLYIRDGVLKRKLTYSYRDFDGVDYNYIMPIADDLNITTNVDYDELKDSNIWIATLWCRGSIIKAYGISRLDSIKRAIIQKSVIIDKKVNW